MKYFLILALIFSNISHADEAQCKFVLHKCDDAVKALQKKSDLDDQIIADQEKRHQIEAKEVKEEAFWRPFAIGSFTVAVGAGIILFFKH